MEQPEQTQVRPEELARIEDDAPELSQAVRQARLALRVGNDPIAIMLRTARRRA